MNKYQALNEFYNSFDIPAYVENAIPKNAVLPYITYEVITNSLSDSGTALSCQLWYKSNSFKEINTKSEEICSALATGVKLQTDDGYIMLYRGTPLTQNISDAEDTTIKCKLINIEADFITI